jgi:uncharacterized protein
MKRVVLDTNLIVSGLFWRGIPGDIYDFAVGGKYLLLVSQALLDELEDVLIRRKFEKQFQQRNITANDFLSAFALLAGVVTPINLEDDSIRDPDDVAVLACAIGGNADIVVTGDKDLLVLQSYRGIKIMTAREFLDLLASEK